MFKVEISLKGWFSELGRENRSKGVGYLWAEARPKILEVERQDRIESIVSRKKPKLENHNKAELERDNCFRVTNVFG